jgi:hypothetical protein
MVAPSCTDRSLRCRPTLALQQVMQSVEMDGSPAPDSLVRVEQAKVRVSREFTKHAGIRRAMVYEKDKRIEHPESAHAPSGQESPESQVLFERKHPTSGRFGPLVDPVAKTVRFRLFVPGRDLDPRFCDAESLGSGPKTRVDARRIREVRVVGTFQHITDGTDWDVLSGIHLFRRSSPDSNTGAIYESEPVPLTGGYFEYNYVVLYEDERVEPCWINDPCSLHRSACGGRDSSAFMI